MAYHRTDVRSIPKDVGPYVVEDSYHRQWDVSPRVAGQLTLKPNKCRLQVFLCRATQKGNADPVYITDNSMSTISSASSWYTNRIMNGGDPSGPFWGALDTRARTRFMGKVRSDPASLGVTLAQWKQAHQMVEARSLSLLNLTGLFLKKYRSTTLKSYKRQFSKGQREKQLASWYLEFIFGWLPLASDLNASLAILTKDRPIQGWARASSGTVTNPLSYSSVTTGEYGVIRSFTGLEKCRVTISASWEVENPNAWLANQLGLLDLPGVAVDIIPWSFVVGMFWNQAAFVGQLTDTIGIDFKDLSVTYSYSATGSGGARGNGRYYGNRSFQATHKYSNKIRDIGVMPNVSAMSKDFKLDSGKAAIFLSLAAQQAERFLPSFAQALLQSELGSTKRRRSRS